MIPIRLNQKKENKLHAKSITVDGFRFDSLAEAKRYGELKLLERNGDISGLKVHPVFPVEIAGRPICKVILDFRYEDKNGDEVFEDVKGKDTALSRLKRKMVEAVYNIDVEIVR